MHWSEIIADKIIQRNPNKEEYVCAAGISPSGSIHIGNFRDVATSYFVAKALRGRGKKARLLFSWDEYDRLRKIPVNVAKIAPDMEQHIGRPYVDVPNPFGDEAENYARYFQREFEQALRNFGIDVDYRYQAAMHRAGHYAPHIVHALKRRREIFDILSSFRTQEAVEGEREAYYPVSIYCPACGKDTTKIVSLADDCLSADYHCACGHAARFDFSADFHCKLAWKVDWAMRWMYEGVDFEPGGKDHASPTGSYQTSKIIATEIFGHEPPLFQGYEFIGIKGATGKMSGSSGFNLTPKTLLQLYQPEIILWLYAKTDPMKAFDFCFDDGILRQYFEFDKQYQEYKADQAGEFTSAVMHLCLIEGRDPEPVPMGLLVQLGSVVNFNIPMLETIFAKIGTPYAYGQFQDRLERARYWLEQCSPQSVNRLREQRNWPVYERLSAEEKQEVALLHGYLTAGGYALDDLNSELYAIPRQVYGADIDDKTIKSRQGRFFKNIYGLLLDKEQGPRLYLFLFAVEKEQYLSLLDFAAPPTDEETQEMHGDTNTTDTITPATESYAQETSIKTEQMDNISMQNSTLETQNSKLGLQSSPEAVQPFLPEIELEQFTQIDLRVCRVVKCEEIRKSHSCLKLTLFDGLGERVIVSSIKQEYRPEDLLGKKIIIIANLKPARLTGITSQGMLLAATNKACGCQVIFADDSIPEGTKVN